MSDFSISRRFDIRLNLRHAGRLFGQQLIRGDPNLDARGEVVDGLGALQADQARMLEGVGARSIEIEDPTPIVENYDVWKTRIPRVGRSGWQRLKKRWAANRMYVHQLLDGEFPLRTRIDILQAGRPLTPQELAELREDIEAQRLDQFHQLQAELGRKRIRNTLTRLGHCSYVEREGHRVIRGEVQIPYVEYNPLYYRYFVNAGTLPWRVSIMDIQGDGVCTDLSAAVGHPVRSEIKKVSNAVIGLQYTIEIAATMGVPNVCKFSDLLPLLPATAPPLAFLTGYSEGKRLRYANLEDMPHFLGGGQTKGGKSNMMHVIACSLISRNSPDALRLLMIDLKFNGIELDRYKGIPHLIHQYEGCKPDSYVAEAPTGIATMPEQAIAILKWAVDEANKRGRMFTKEGKQNLRQWNHSHPTRRLPYIVIINDELAQLRLEKEHGAAAYDLLQKILSTARAAGISFVTFTQSSNARVIDEFIKINLPGRICFSVTDAPSSILFVGNGSAVGLMPAGRAIYKHGTEEYLCQVPLIEPNDIAEVVANAHAGKLTGHLSDRPVLPEEVIEWAIEHNQSGLQARALREHFVNESQRCTELQLERLLREMDGQDYRVGEHRYQVLPGIGRRPRGLVSLDKLGIPDPAAPESQDKTQDTTQICAYCRTRFDDPMDLQCRACGAPIEEDSA